jgi:muramoyltetrapeptide carboxypeptidase
MLKKPEALQPGDRIGIVAPGGLFRREAFEAGIEFVKKQGLVPVLGKNIFKEDFIYAGTVKERLDDLYAALKDPSLKAVWCVRAGYGVYAVAEELAKKPVPKKPKIIMGMSDVTALHILMTQKWKWPSLHSPLLDRIANEKSSDIERQSLIDALSAGKRLKITSRSAGDSNSQSSSRDGVFNADLNFMGKAAMATGPLIGGNLVLLSASLGTKWEIDTRGKILFIEEIGERAYRIDRFLWQLENAGKFKGVKGIVLGDFTECQEPDGRPLWLESLKRKFAKAPFPVLTGVPSGHGPLRLTLPMGVKVRIKTGAVSEFEVVEDYAKSR